MKTIYVLYDELKRSSWVFLVAMGCMLLGSNYIFDSLKGFYFHVLNNNYIYDVYIENIIAAIYLPFVILLALSQYRGKNEDFRSSMPYTADGLYFIRLLYGIIAILTVTVIQWAVLGLLFNNYAFVITDLKDMGVNLAVFINPLHFVLVLFGMYVFISLILQLVANRFGAAFMAFTLALMPEMLAVPYQWIFGEAPGWEGLFRIKYTFFPGICDNELKTSVYLIGVLVYAVIVGTEVLAGMYVNRKTNGAGRSRMFYNKGVKAVFIALGLLFALNIFDMIFIQGGL